MPHHKGAGSPHPIRVSGPDLWYQMALVDIHHCRAELGLLCGGRPGGRKSVVSKAGGWGVGRVGLPMEYLREPPQCSKDKEGYQGWCPAYRKAGYKDIFKYIHL
jgi:hypothetical protein